MANKVHGVSPIVTHNHRLTLCGSYMATGSRIQDLVDAVYDYDEITCAACTKVLNKHELRHNIVQLPDSCPLCKALHRA